MKRDKKDEILLQIGRYLEISNGSKMDNLTRVNYQQRAFGLAESLEIIEGKDVYYWLDQAERMN